MRSIARIAAVGGHQELFILAGRAHEELNRYRQALAEELLKDR